MKTKSALSVITFLAGLGILVACFFIWKGEAQTNVFALNLAVSTLIYCLLFMDMLTPWIDLSDKSQKQVGSLGMRWLVTGLYTVLAVGAMFAFQYAWPADFTLQLIVHCVLLFCMCCGFVMAFSMSDKVAEVQQKELEDRNGINRMKKAMAKVQDSLADQANIPTELAAKISEVAESLRYISPSGNPDAAEYENEFVKLARDLESALASSQRDKERIETLTKKLSRTVQNRKNIY